MNAVRELGLVALASAIACSSATVETNPVDAGPDAADAGGAAGAGGAECTMRTTTYPDCQVHEGEACDQLGETVACCALNCAYRCGTGGGQPWSATYECVLTDGGSTRFRQCSYGQGPPPSQCSDTGGSPPVADSGPDARR